MIQKIRDYFNKQDPDKQKKISSLLVIGLMLLFALTAYYLRGGKKGPKQEENIPVSELNPRLGYLEKSLYYETTSKLKAVDEKLKALELQLKALDIKLKSASEKSKVQKQSAAPKGEKNKAEKEISAPFGAKEMLDKIIKERTFGKPQGPTYPPPPRAVSRTAPGRPGKQPQVKKVIGAIGTIEGKAPVVSRKPQEDKKKKTKKREGGVYLPPSFMEADLISGFRAPTLEAAKSEPVRVFLRIRDLAVLPNRVKGDLKGCFAIAEAYGNLADERAHLRLLRLSCIARDGSSVIDESIKGFVIDEDGGIGLNGRVVTKMGSMLARSMAASFLQGFGDAYAATGLVVNTSGIGQTASLNPDEALKSGLGRGISGGAKEFAKFYMELARQTFPVIEVGAGKRVTVVIDEGIDLKIKKKCLGGKNGCKDRDGFIYALDAF